MVTQLVSMLPASLQAPALTDLGRESRLGFVALERLYVDPAYQRPIDAAGWKHVRAMAERFDWSLFGALVVSPLGAEQFAVIDGQHRALAAALVGAHKVPVIVTFGDPKAQARAFAAINGTVKAVTLFDVFRAALKAGEAWAVVASAIAERAGCRLMDYNRPTAERKPGEIYSIAYFRTLAESGDEGRKVSAGRALQALDCAQETSVSWQAVPLQAWLDALHQVPAARRADMGSLVRFLQAQPLVRSFRNAQHFVAVRKEAGSPSVSVLDELTASLVDALDSYFSGASA